MESWNPGAARNAILDFVERATSPGVGFIEPGDRIATFDNDGTLWVEQPLPVQFNFIFAALIEAVKETPSLATEQPYKAIIEKDHDFFEKVGLQDPDAVSALEGAIARAWHDSTPDRFESEAQSFLEGARSERFGRPSTELVYQPMMELLELLRTNGFRVFICSGGGRDFMRVMSDNAFGIPRENVIGSAPRYEFRVGQLHRTDEVLGGVALGAGKPEHIFAATGRLPAIAGGNSDGDIEMLEAASFRILISHDDAEREFTYTEGAERAFAEAEKSGWTVVSIKNDWKVVFG
ncbi:MAG: haloacid dehalogenase-like hydrolase [Thermoleophilales bacterium]|nr:haloacid dehalogenase-like hydrolase [Thermoleophilales bacterium]